MSLDAMVWSMKQRGLKPAEKAVLHSLAYHSDDKGECFPSYRLIGEEAGISRRSAITIVQRLQEKQYIFLKKRYKSIDDERRDQTSNLFRLNMKVTSNVVNSSFKEPVGSQSTSLRPGENISLPSEVGDNPLVKQVHQGGEARDTRVVKRVHPGSEAASPEQVIEQVTEQVSEERAPRVENSTDQNQTTTQPKDPRVKFQMHLDWQPDEQFDPFSAMCGIDPKSVTDAELMEFRRYWAGEHNEHTESQWQNKLVKSLKRNRVYSHQASPESFTPVELVSDEEQAERDRIDELNAERMQVIQEIQHFKRMIDVMPGPGKDEMAQQLTNAEHRLKGIEVMLKMNEVEA